MALRKLIFDSATRGDFGVTFSRAAATRDRLGNAVASGVIRYGRRRALGETPTFAQVTTFSSQSAVPLGSGYDDDGTTPVSLVSLPTTRSIRVYSGTGWTLQRTLDLTRVETGGNVSDVLSTFAGLKKTHYYYQPIAGVVCHGLVVLYCVRFYDVNENPASRSWQEDGISFIYSTDNLATVAFVPYAGGGDDVPGLTGYRDWGRGNLWAFQNYFPGTAERTAPLDAWFPACDYVIDTGKSPQKPGGQAMLFRATRPSIGGTWAVQPVALVDNRYQTDAAAAYTTMHYHSAGVCLKHAGELHLIVAKGDTDCSGLVRLICSDPADYTDAGNWTRQANFHGLADQSATVGAIGNQGAGMCPGPTFGDILMGSDESESGLYRIEVPASHSAKATITGLWGRYFQTGNRYPYSLWCVSPAPERGGPYIARVQTDGGGMPTTTSARVLYSRDGDRWYPIASGVRVLPFIHGGVPAYLTTTQVMGASAVSAATAYRPALVSPGGRNYCQGTVLATANLAAEDSVTTRDSAWLATNGIPEPPCLGIVREVVCATSATNTSVEQRLTNLSIYTTGRIRGRCWIYALDDGASPNVEFHPANRTPGPSAHGTVASGWTPIVWQGTPPSAADGAIWLRLADVKRPMRFLVAFDIAATGDALFGYPPPLAPSSAPGYIDAPNELLDVTGLACGSRWTIAIAGGMPDDDWDCTVALGVTETPLWTLYGSATEYVTAVYDLTNDAVRFDVVSGGSTTTITASSIAAVRDDLYKIAVARTDSGTEVSVQWGGGTITTGSNAAAITTAPTRVRFGNAGQTSVAPQEVYAVAVDESSGYSAANRATLIQSEYTFASGLLPSRRRCA